ncbi:ABC transporter permease [Nakamurella lactea]|uniref:ABC transporter permease n=1 Tax=Nakamurella lactea TaxID=459515 RepID=UPI0003FE94AB|nr:ABC transporter permease [Nakamurella lactea]
MGAYLLRRLASTVLVFFLITIVVFTLIHLAPGDPIAMQIPPDQYTSATQDFIAAKRHELGLDRALPIQYLTWIGHAFTGDLGLSIVNGRPVSEIIGERIVPTLELMSLGMILAIVIALVFGTWAAVRKNRIVDYVITFFSMLTISTPGFFIGIMAIYLFSVKLKLLPSAGMSTTGVHTTADALKHLILPVTILGLTMSAGLLRFVRGAMISELTADYQRTALAKGLTRGGVVVKHVFRNALIPILTVIAYMIPQLLSGAVLIESVFAWPGMGSMVVDEAAKNDFPVLIAFAMLTAILVLLSNLVADVLYTLVDPRVKLR